MTRVSLLRSACMTIMQRIGDGVLSANQSTISPLTPAHGPGEQLNIYAYVDNDHMDYGSCIFCFCLCFETLKVTIFHRNRYVNNFDETFVYECTTGAGVITGATRRAQYEKYWVLIKGNKANLQAWKVSMTMEQRIGDGATSAAQHRWNQNVTVMAEIYRWKNDFLQL